MLSYEQADAKARAMVAAPNGGGKIKRLTVRKALEIYIEHKRNSLERRRAGGTDSYRAEPARNK